MRTINENKTYELGLSVGMFSGLFWGLSTVLSGIILVTGAFVSTEQAIILSPLVGAFLNYTFSTIWLTVYMVVRGNFKSTFKSLKQKSLKTKSGRAVVFGALCGGPFGFGCYLLAISFIGAGYAASISAIFPVLTGLFSYIFLKEKLKSKNWAGLLLSILAIAIMWYAPSEGGVENFTLGLILAIGSAIGWALESVICAYGMKGDEVSSEEALYLRKLVATLAYGVLIIPFISGFGLTIEVLSSNLAIFLAGIALIGTVSYGLYYKAIDIVGPGRATGLNVTYAAWTVFFEVIFLGTMVTPILLICVMLIICGTILVSKK